MGVVVALGLVGGGVGGVGGGEGGGARGRAEGAFFTKMYQTLAS